jgi:hypothetical protein
MSGSTYMILLRNRSSPQAVSLLKRCFSSAAVSADLPTRHSWKQPPPVCQDLKELEESTAAILEEPVGALYASATKIPPSTEAQRSDIYDAADATIQQVEYLIRGHSSKVPGALYNQKKDAASDQPQQHLDKMQQLLQRMQKEGSMYMQLREEQLKLLAASEREDSESDSDSESGGDSDSDSDSDSDNDSSSSSSDEEDDDGEETLDFSPPGGTITMYDAVLDAMAVAPNTNPYPLDFFQTSMQALSAHELDSQYVLQDSQQKIMHRDKYSIATPITYHAALRGISEKTDFENPKYRDDALNAAFGLYNHLSHSDHLPRNTASILYMVQIVDKALPASRVKGNISVTFWKQACQIGVISPAVVEAIQSMHEDNACGPEFDVLLKQLDTPLDQLPQRYRRAVNKNRHSQHY